MPSSTRAEGSRPAVCTKLPSVLSFLCLLIVICHSYSQVSYQNQSSPVIFWDGKTLAEVLLSDAGEILHCRLHELDDPADAEPLIKNSGLPAQYPSFKMMLELINNCSELELPVHNLASSIATNQSETNNTISKWSPWALWNGILPGTKWCGVGDIASTFEELGSQAIVDSCCRAHDHCPVKLKAFRVGYGMINLSFYTKSHCDCDRLFHRCLKLTNNKLADAVGNFYFNFMRVQCLRERKLYVCVENRTEVDGFNDCVRWSVDPDHSKMESIITDLKY